MKDIPRITESEWLIMKVVWERTPCSAHEIVRSLVTNNKWKPATVKTFVGRLVRKQILYFEKRGKSYLYFPRYSRQQCCQAELELFLERVFDNDSLKMLSSLIELGSMSSLELKAYAKNVKKSGTSL